MLPVLSFAARLSTSFLTSMGLSAHTRARAHALSHSHARLHTSELTNNTWSEVACRRYLLLLNPRIVAAPCILLTGRGRWLCGRVQNLFLEYSPGTYEQVRKPRTEFKDWPMMLSRQALTPPLLSFICLNTTNPSRMTLSCKVLLCPTLLYSSVTATQVLLINVPNVQLIPQTLRAALSTHALSNQAAIKSNLLQNASSCPAQQKQFVYIVISLPHLHSVALSRVVEIQGPAPVIATPDDTWNSFVRSMMPSLPSSCRFHL